MLTDNYNKFRVDENRMTFKGRYHQHVYQCFQLKWHKIAFVPFYLNEKFYTLTLNNFIFIEKKLFITISVMPEAYVKYLRKN